MTHLGERITDFVFAELSVAEMDEARRHVAECRECREQVQQFERTRHLLKTSPDVDPPRQIVFEVEPKPAFTWRWLMPVGAAAAVVLVVLLVVPMQFQWNASQLTIAFGTAPAQAPVTAVSAPPVVAPVVTPAIDYDRIVKAVQDSQQTRLASQTFEMQRLRGQMTYLAVNQQAVERKNIENSTSIQLLAERLGAQD